MLKILYAAGNSENSKIQCQRFLKAIKNQPYIVKIAAYIKSSPKNTSIDWTLDSLLNIYKPNHISLDNDNLNIYFDQIKYYHPDLIISDLEYFTSYIANILNIDLWQCNSSLINYAVINNQKYNLGLFKNYSYLLHNFTHSQQILNIVDNSEYNFVYSHLGDTQSPPILKNNFKWIRPYHSIGKFSVPCQHNIVAGILHNNKKVLSYLKKYSDSVVFTEFFNEKYSNLYLKDIQNEAEYFCNLKNSNLFMCEGQTSFLADAFYNGKYAVTLINFKDPECITNSFFSEQLKLSSCLYDTSNDLNLFMNREITPSFDQNIKYLDEWLKTI